MSSFFRRFRDMAKDRSLYVYRLKDAALKEISLVDPFLF